MILAMIVGVSAVAAYRDRQGRVAALWIAFYINVPSIEAHVASVLGTVTHVSLQQVSLGALLAVASCSALRDGIPPRIRAWTLGASLLLPILLLRAEPAAYRLTEHSKAASLMLFVVGPSLCILAISTISVRWLVATSVISTIPLAIHVILSGTGLGAGSGSYDRLYTTNSVWYGRALAIGMISAVVLHRISARYRWFLLSVAILYGLALARSDKWGPIIASGVALAFLIVVRRQEQPSPRHSLRPVAAVTSFLLALAALRPFVGAWLTTRVDDYGNASLRINFAQHAWTEFLHSPILGTGLGTFRDVDRGQLVFYPHNVELEVLGELGIFFTVALLLALVGLFRYRREPLFGLWLLCFGFAQTSGGLVENIEWPVLAAALVVVGRTRHSDTGALEAVRAQVPAVSV